MYCDRATVDHYWRHFRGEPPYLPTSIGLRSLDGARHSETEVKFDPLDDDHWLRMQLLWPEPTTQGKVVQAIEFVVEELEKGPGPVQLIVTPATWHPFADVIVFRPFSEGIRPSQRIISLRGYEEMLWRPPYSLDWWSAPQRRTRRPVHLIFDRAEIVAPVEPTRWDLMLFAAHRVREHLPAIERI